MWQELIANKTILVPCATALTLCSGILIHWFTIAVLCIITDWSDHYTGTTSMLIHHLTKESYIIFSYVGCLSWSPYSCSITTLKSWAKAPIQPEDVFGEIGALCCRLKQCRANKNTILLFFTTPFSNFSNV